MYMYIQYIHVHVYRNAFNILQYIISYWLLRNQNLNYLLMQGVLAHQEYKAEQIVEVHCLKEEQCLMEKASL